MADKLTPKQKRFASEYLVDLNATRAAIRAGYSEKTAYSIGQENLKKPEIQTALQEAILHRQQRTEITQDRVVREIASVGFSKAADSAESELKVGNKLKALELLGKHLGLFERTGAASEQESIDAFVRATRPTAEELEELYAREDK